MTSLHHVSTKTDSAARQRICNMRARSIINRRVMFRILPSDRSETKCIICACHHQCVRNRVVPMTCVFPTGYVASRPSLHDPDEIAIVVACRRPSTYLSGRCRAPRLSKYVQEYRHKHQACEREEHIFDRDGRERQRHRSKLYNSITASVQHAKPGTDLVSPGNDIIMIP